MNTSRLIAFLPELVLLAGALGLFFVTLGQGRSRQAKTVALLTAVAAIVASLFCLGEDVTLFYGAYRVDLFSQVLKLVFAGGFLLVLLLNGDLGDIRDDIKPEYYLFLAISVSGLTMLVSCIDIITLVAALEVSAFPLYLMVPMRRERQGQRSQMESAIKYMMFGVAANGLMLFGLGYLFGLTGTTSLPVMVCRLEPLIGSPMAIAGLAMTLCGLYYKLAIFPFHFWTPDVYQGASNETAGLVASLPKIGGVAVLVRFVSLASDGNHTLGILLTVLAAGSMFYGNLVALMQKDFKRLLGFSGIAHAGYALVGFVAVSEAGYSAAIYYIIGYFLMVLACFVVICKVSKDGTNVGIDELAGLHRRAPLLALTLAVGVFALAGMPPFVGFMGKFSILTAAWSNGHQAIVIIAVVNAAIAVYYYLSVIREAWFRDPGNLPAIRLDMPTRVLCVCLITGILALGIVPAKVMETISMSVAKTTQVSSYPRTWPKSSARLLTRRVGSGKRLRVEGPPKKDRFNTKGTKLKRRGAGVADSHGKGLKLQTPKFKLQTSGPRSVFNDCLCHKCSSWVLSGLTGMIANAGGCQGDARLRLFKEVFNYWDHPLWFRR